MQEMINYDSPPEIQQFLSGLGIAARKRFGQNFLINRGARAKLIAALNLTSKDEVWEIGPGLGAMTAMLIDSPAAALKVFEIDHAYQQVLTTYYADQPRFAVVCGDVLKTWHTATPTGTLKVLGNLPYNISASILQKLLEQPMVLGVFTVQKELAERLRAKISTKSYSSLSVWAQAVYTITFNGVLKAGSFYPVPNVESAIITLTPNPIDRALLPILDHCLKYAFGHRRKSLRNNMAAAAENGPLHNVTYPQLQEVMASVGLEEHRRAEEFTPDIYVALVRGLKPLV